MRVFWHYDLGVADMILVTGIKGLSGGVPQGADTETGEKKSTVISTEITAPQSRESPVHAWFSGSSAVGDFPHGERERGNLQYFSRQRCLL